MKRIKAIGYSLSCLLASAIWGKRNMTLCTAVFMKAWSIPADGRYAKIETVLDWLAKPWEKNHCFYSYMRWIKHTGRDK